MLNPGYDNEMDYLIREAAGKYDTPGEPNWQKMEEELNRVMPAQPPKRRKPFLWWALPLLLLIGGGGYWLLQTKQDAAIPVLKTVPVADAATDNPHTSSKTNIAVDRGNVEAEKNTIAEPDTHEPAEKIVSANTIKSLQKNRYSAPAANSIAEAKLPVTAASDESHNKPIPSQQASKAMDQPMIQKPVVPDVKNSSDVLKDTKEQLSDKSALANTPSTIENHELKAEEPIIWKIIDPVVYPPGKWSFALLAGFDKSTVKFKYNNDPGYNIGLMAGYHFNGKISLHTGAIYTQKNYKLAGEDFTAPKGSWVSYYKLENVTGYCRMWEVPLLLRYTVSKKGKNSVYLSTGLSSYFMTSENYNYFFYNLGQPVTRNAAYSSSETNIISIVHLSAGFESQLSKTLSLQIEPYAKIPLDGLGLGNIKLSSFGLNFSLQHRQPSKK